ncbi:hypothetical protein P9112_012421 [Eukaryota sp. TZLM1-RC]
MTSTSSSSDPFSTLSPIQSTPCSVSVDYDYGSARKRPAASHSKAFEGVKLIGSSKKDEPPAKQSCPSSPSPPSQESVSSSIPSNPPPSSQAPPPIVFKIPSKQPNPSQPKPKLVLPKSSRKLFPPKIPNDITPKLTLPSQTSLPKQSSLPKAKLLPKKPKLSLPTLPRSSAAPLPKPPQLRMGTVTSSQVTSGDKDCLLGNKNSFYSFVGFKYVDGTILDIEKSICEMKLFLGVNERLVSLTIPDSSYYFDVEWFAGQYMYLIIESTKDWPWKDFVGDCFELTLPNNLYIITDPDVLVPVTLISSVMNQPYGCLRSSVLNGLLSGHNESFAMLFGQMSHEVFQWVVLNPQVVDDDVIDSVLGKYSLSLAACEESLSFVHDLMSKQLKSIRNLVDFIKNGGIIESKLGKKTGNSIKFDQDCSFIGAETRIWNPIFGIKGKVDVVISGSVEETQQEKVSSKVKCFPVEVKTSQRYLTNSDLVPKVNQSYLNQSLLYSLLVADFLGLNPMETSVILLHLGVKNPSQAFDLIEPRYQELSALLACRCMIASYLKPRIPLYHPFPFKLPPINGNCRTCYSKDACTTSRLALECVPIPDLEGLTSTVNQIRSATDGETVLFVNHFALSLNQTVSSLDSCFWKFSIQPQSSKLISARPLSRVFNFKDFTDSKWELVFTKPEEFDCPPGTCIWISVVKIGDFDFDWKRNGLAQSIGHVIRVSDDILIEGQFPLPLPIANQLCTMQFNDYFISNISKYFGFVEFRIDQASANDNNSFLISSLMRFLTVPVRQRALIVSLSRPEFSNDLTFQDFSQLIVENDTSVAEPYFDLFNSLADLNLSLSVLNNYQLSAVYRALTFLDYFLIFGMPGTGKSKTIAHICLVLMLFDRKCRILVTSNSHAAVNSVFSKLIDLVGTNENLKYRLIRFKFDDSQGLLEDKFSPFLVHRLCDPEQIKARLNNCSVIATTLAQCSRSSLLSSLEYDVVIVDEASQTDFPGVISAINLAKKFILVGDHLQLAPISSTSVTSGTSNISSYKSFDSLFCYLGANHPYAVVSLPLQYRMNKEITNLANFLIYSDQLRTNDSFIANSTLSLPNFKAFSQSNPFHWAVSALNPSVSVVFCNTDALASTEEVVNNSIKNETESAIASILVNSLLKSGCSTSNIAVITPYRAQIEALTHAISNATRFPININSVDAFQGSESEVVCFSFVRSNNEGEVGKLLPDWRRINVAITRAKRKLFFIGSVKFLCKSYLLKELINYCQEKNCVVDVGPLIHPS